MPGLLHVGRLGLRWVHLMMQVCLYYSLAFVTTTDRYIAQDHLLSSVLDIWASSEHVKHSLLQRHQCECFVMLLYSLHAAHFCVFHSHNFPLTSDILLPLP